MYEIVVGIIALLVLLLLFGTGIELGFAMALVGFVGFAILNGFHRGCSARANMNLTSGDWSPR